MAYIITLATLDEIFHLPGQDQLEKIRGFLPVDICREMFGQDGNCSATYANYTFKSSFNGSNLGAKEAYKQSATFISELPLADVKKYLDEISNRWSKAMKSKSDIFGRRAYLRKILEGDDDYKKITTEFQEHYRP